MLEIECVALLPTTNLNCNNSLFHLLDVLSGSIASWETLIELFTTHFQSMKVPVKIEHVRFCVTETTKSFREYVQRLRNLASQMNDTPDLKEIIQICAMNSGPASWYLIASPCAIFEDLFKRALTYEELDRSGFAWKDTQFTLVNAEVDAIAALDYNSRRRDRQDKSKFDKGKNTLTDEHPRKQLRDSKGYAFELKDTERWFGLLLKEGKITPLKPKEPVQPDDKRHEEYCRFHYYGDFMIKDQLPGVGLTCLINPASDEDLKNMLEEHRRSSMLVRDHLPASTCLFNSCCLARH